MKLSRLLPLRASNAHLLATARPAVAMSLFGDVRVGGIIWVALWAVSFVSVPRPTLPIPVASDVHPLAAARSAVARSVFVDAGVGGVVSVALRTVCSLTKVAPAPANILRARDRFQMSGIHAMANSAEMIELKSFRDSANDMFVNKPVRRVAFLSPATVAITLTADRTRPKPALAKLSIRDVFGEKIVFRLDADRIGRHLGNSHFPDCRAGECLPHSSAHSFNHEEAV